MSSGKLPFNFFNLVINLPRWVTLHMDAVMSPTIWAIPLTRLPPNTSNTALLMAMKVEEGVVLMVDHFHHRVVPMEAPIATSTETLTWDGDLRHRGLGGLLPNQWFFQACGALPLRTRLALLL